MRGLCILVLLLVAGRPLYGQPLHDTLRTVIKSSTRKARPGRIITPEGIKQLVVDSAVLDDYRGQNMATLLAQQLPVFVRTYGTNGLATLALRGASAAQTAVRWNGVPIQSGSTGLVDLVLIPVPVVDEVKIEYGSNAGTMGSGAVGGVLQLGNSTPTFRNAHDYSLFGSAGSYGRLQGGLKLKQSGKLWAGSLVATAQQARNDFEYQDNAGTTRRLSNAGASSMNLQGSLAHKLSAANTIEGFIWMSRSTRDIPPALFEAHSFKQQQDEALRTLLSYTHTDARCDYGLQLSMIDEWFRYNDSTARINTNLHARQWFVNPYYKAKIGKGRQVTVALPVQWNYLIDEPAKQLTRSAVTVLMEQPGRVSYSVNGRAELINGKLFYAGGANAAFKLLPAFSIRGSAGYAYRYPTLNELYYTPGGNPDLLPEKGWNTEAGYTWMPALNARLQITHSVTGFYRNMHNWILWFGGAIWTPHNIARVASSGLETENKLTWTRPKASWQLSANASYISSRTIESSLPGDGSIGRQIPYAPRIIGQGNLGFNTAKLRLNYNHTYTGLRYFNTDETGEIPAFGTGNIQAGYLVKQGRWSLDINLQAQNIWNNRYAEVAFRPAPGINWQAGLVIREAK